MDRYVVRARVRDACVDDVKTNTLKENTCLLFIEIFKSQNLIQVISQTHWCAHPRPSDARFTLIMIFDCFLLREKIKHKKMLVLGP